MPWVVCSVVLAVVGLLVLAAFAVPVVREVRRLATTVHVATASLDQAAAGLRAATAAPGGIGDPSRRTAPPSGHDDEPPAGTGATGAPAALPGMRRPEIPASPLGHPHGVSS